MSGAAPAPPPDTATDFPVLLDAGGYQLQPRDAAFIGVSLDSLRAVAGRAYPLGFPSSEEWQTCLAELRAALQGDGLLDADVRLKGTAADFFSRHPDKLFPRNGGECHAIAAARGSDGPAAEARWNAAPYAMASVLPNRCFWDCRHQLGISGELSDYDFQISSSTLESRILAMSPSAARQRRALISRDGGQYRDAVVRRGFPALDAWSARWQAQLKRNVNIAGFPAAGPTALISRFDANDWVVVP